MRADRLLAILMLLQKRKRITAQELACELEVSERTIYRDITALGTAGVPITTERGPGGGVSLVEHYRSDLTGLNRNEVQALFMVSIPPALGDLGLDRELKTALLKLSAELPTKVWDDEINVRQRVYIDPLAWEQVQRGDLTHLNSIYKAVWNDQEVHVRYYSMGGRWIGPIDAIIQPYGLVAKGGNWYLVGFSGDHIAVLRIDYLLDLQITDRIFERPDTFDLEDFWKGWCLESVENTPCFPVLVRVSSKSISSFWKYLDDGILAHFKEMEDDDHNGSITFEIKFEYFEQALESLLAFGGAVEVLEPVALRKTIQDYAGQILAVYSGK